MRDTTPEAAEVQALVLRGLAPGRRLELAMEMSRTARSLLTGRIRAEHPDWLDSQVTRELVRLCYPGTEPPIIPG